MATNVLVGQCLGENDIPKAKSYFKLIMIYACAVYFLIVFLLYYFAIEVASLYTTDHDLLGVCSDGIKVMVVFNMIYGIGKVLEGVIRGIGKHGFATVVMIISYYIISIPLIIW